MPSHPFYLSRRLGLYYRVAKCHNSHSRYIRVEKLLKAEHFNTGNLFPSDSFVADVWLLLTYLLTCTRLAERNFTQAGMISHKWCWWQFFPSDSVRRRRLACTRPTPTPTRPPRHAHCTPNVLNNWHFPDGNHCHSLPLSPGLTCRVDTPRILHCLTQEVADTQTRITDEKCKVGYVKKRADWREGITKNVHWGKAGRTMSASVLCVPSSFVFVSVFVESKMGFQFRFLPQFYVSKAVSNTSLWL